ncbi:hypothetical protein [Polymorphobacter megasporae]|uniref:hypothetical protein n=1 Tax=Glacieibacterium megasporae TaxID=2835787 RepID=UPI001C1DD5EC|nr:hypothetical protein [Polymorphobacter megasporae]UAJ08644.1 hypothetical protein KTC28_09525 [Polymorphobacter megasporae]
MAVDSVPEMRGMGVKVAEGGRIVTLRGSKPDEPFVVIELRPPLRPTRPATVSTPAEEKPNIGKEWGQLALNLGGATLSWIGVVGTAAAAPETGGLSLTGTVVMWSGAIASSAQVLNSVGRLTAIYSGHGALVTKADKTLVYVVANDALDFAGLFGSAAAFKEAAALEKGIGKTGARTWDLVQGSPISRPMRRQLTEALELQGMKRVPAARITLIVRMKLLNAFAAVYGISASSYSGALHDVSVLIVHSVQK